MEGGWWKLTHVDGAREGGALGEHGETVAQIGHVVLGLHFVSVKRFVTLVMNDKELDQPLSQFSAMHACQLFSLFVCLDVHVTRETRHLDYLPGGLEWGRIC